jgi:GTPase
MKLEFDADTIGEGFATGFRKGVDSTTSAAVMHAINLVKRKDWKELVGHIKQELEQLGDVPVPVKKEEDIRNWSVDYAWGKLLAPVFKRACLKWKPYGKGSEAMVLSCLFEIIPDSDWDGVASFFAYGAIPKETQE